MKNKKLICVDTEWRRTSKDYIITATIDGGKHWTEKMYFKDRETALCIYVDALNAGFEPLDEMTKWIMRGEK